MKSLIALGIVLSTLGVGQYALPVPAGAAPQEEPKPFLLALRGTYVVMNYSPGALDRAVHVQRRLELMASDFMRWSGVELQLRVFVLAREEWQKFGFLLPYGIPGRIPTTTLAVPSYGDRGTISLWTDIRGFPPAPLPGIPMKGTAEEAATLAMSDLLMQVEAARILVSSGGLRGDAPWLQQLLAHLVAATAFETYEAARLPEIDDFFASLAAGEAEPLALDQYVSGLDLGSYLWFESQFYAGARRLMQSGKKGDKKNEAKELLKQIKKRGLAITEDEFLTAFPEMRSWLEETFATSRAVPE